MIFIRPLIFLEGKHISIPRESRCESCPQQDFYDRVAMGVLVVGVGIMAIVIDRIEMKTKVANIFILRVSYPNLRI